MKTRLTHLLAYCKSQRPRGGMTAVAADCGVPRGTFWQWLYRGNVPPEYAPAVELVTGVPRWHLRPSDWHRIWPELMSRPGAPAAPIEEAEVV